MSRPKSFAAPLLAILLFATLTRSLRPWTFEPLVESDPSYKFVPSGVQIKCLSLDDRCVRKLACSFAHSASPVVVFASNRSSFDGFRSPGYDLRFATYSVNGTSCDGNNAFPFAPEMLAVALTPFGDETDRWFQLEYPFRAKPCRDSSECSKVSPWVANVTGVVGLVPPCSRMLHPPCGFRLSDSETLAAPPTL